ncbi:hypothetical protein ACFYO8_28135 [Micromonospora sp. NPDC005257]|uniref:poly(ethylene terephthalate) hydrolase family protein n=1 Tax=Micromonospora sp. NPDC005257 TaxID=3364230 RepID=UPI0036894B99
MRLGHAAHPAGPAAGRPGDTSDRRRPVHIRGGPFAITQTTVSASSVSGFRGGTIYYPTSTAEGTFGATGWR